MNALAWIKDKAHRFIQPPAPPPVVETPILIPLQDPEPEQTVDLENEAPINYVEAPQPGGLRVFMKEGWVTAKFQDLIDSSPLMKERIDEYLATVTEWMEDIDDTWWKGLYPYTRAQMVSHANHMIELCGDEGQLRLRRKITASGILFNHAVPRNLFVHDEVVTEWVLRYHVLTLPTTVSLSELGIWDTYLDVPNLSHTVKWFMAHEPIMTAMFEWERPPSLSHMWLNMGFPLDIPRSFSKEQLKKILTCIHLCAGVSLPLDYLYVDLDVHDFVRKTGNHEVERPTVP